jgi:K+-sensing histidine kinase KdpD
VASNVPQNLVGDALRIGQILINYANNAVKFTERGEVGIVVRMEQAQGDDVTLRLEVRDTGIGLTPSNKTSCSRASSRPMPPPRGATAARAWGWPSARAWRS